MTHLIRRSVWAVIACSTLYAQAPTSYSIRTAAGIANNGDGGTATSALLEFPAQMATDSAGNLYISEIDGGRIRRIARTTGIITTFAGRGVRVSDGDGGPALQAGFIAPSGLAFDNAGNLYVADRRACRIRRITPEGVINTHAGNGNCASSANGVAATSPINGPEQIAFDPQGRLVFTELLGHRIRRIEANGTLGTVAGTGVQSFDDNENDGEMAAQTGISHPAALAIAADGTVYFSQVDYNCYIRRISPAGILTSIAGDDGDCDLATTGTAADKNIGQVFGLLLVGTTLYFSDIDHNVVQQIDLVANPPRLSTFMGPQTEQPFDFAGDGGPPESARLAAPAGLLRESSGAILVADQWNHRVRRVQGALVTTFAGTRRFAGDGGLATAARLFRPSGVAFDANGELFIADKFHNRIRRVNGAGTISTFAGSSDFPLKAGNGGQSTAARLYHPQSVFVHPDGQAFTAEGDVRDTIHDLLDEIRGDGGGIRRITPAGIISALDIAGQIGLVVANNLTFLHYSAPTQHQTRRLDIATGTVSVVAGTGVAGFSGDGGLATAARLNTPTWQAFDTSGNLYIADKGNNRIRRVGATDGIISTIVGDGTAGITGENGPGAQARLDSPGGVAWDPGGFLWIADRTRILRYTPADGRVVRVAGRDTPGDGGDGGPALGAFLNQPQGMRFSAGKLFFADEYNHRVRVLEPLTATRVELTGGSSQNGQVGVALTLSTRVLSSDSIAVPGVTVRFTITAGTGALSSATAVTNNEGVASVTLTPSASGTITVSVVAGTLSPVIYTITVAATGPTITISSVIAAGAFGGGTVLPSGGWLEIYGSNLSNTTREWGGADFDGANAPTELDGVRVLIGGRRAAVRFVSGGQINAQAPDGLTPGPVQVVAQLGSATSAPFTITIAARSPALLAPPAFKVGARQYVAALFPDNVTFAAPDEIAPGLTRRAQSGDRLILYGINFGATVPPVASGTITGVVNALPNIVVRINGVEAVIEFAGLAGSAIGLYQINIILPANLSGDVSLTITVDGVDMVQELFLAVIP